VVHWGYQLLEASAMAVRRAVPAKLPVKDRCGVIIMAPPVADSETPDSDTTDTLGRIVGFSVDAVFKDTSIQVARVRPGPMGLVISHAAHTDVGAAVHRALAAPEDHRWVPMPRALPVSGRRCVVVEAPPDPLATLRPDVKARILEFCEAAGATLFEHCWEETETETETGTLARGAVLALEPNDLTPEQRALVHEFAGRVGLASETTGHPMKRLALTKTTKVCRPGPGKTPKLNRLFEPRVMALTDGSTAGMLRLVGGPGAHDGHPSDHVVAAAQRQRCLKAAEVTSWSLADLGMATPGPAMVILRGLPGSGKSTIAAALAGLVQAEGGVCVVVSADDVVGPDRADAHAACVGAARDAVSAGAAMVVVDNTNLRRSDFAAYVDVARVHGYGVVVLQLECPTPSAAIEFQRRSMHGVRFDTSMAMYHRYQTCLGGADDSFSTAATIVRVEPWRKPSASEGIMAWLTRRGYVSNVLSAGTTHLAMAAGAGKLKCVSIPRSRTSWQEFFAACAADGGPKYLMDAVPMSGPFRFFMDLDNVTHSEGAEGVERDMVAFAEALARAQACNVVVTWCTDNNTIGVHVHTDVVVAGPEEALAFLDVACTGLPCAADREVYARGNGLRMVGSRKVTHGVDAGREYMVMHAAGPAAPQDCKASLEGVLAWTCVAAIDAL
jgi:predicted kinase